MEKKEEKGIPIFSRVKCRGYMAVTHDGVRMEIYKPDGSFFNDNTSHLDGTQTVKAYKGEDEIADLSEWCGETVHKMYRKHAEDDFEGVLVGYKRINCEGEIGTDMSYWPAPYCKEYYHLIKEITYRPKVGVVYYRNNCKRYVLPEDMEAVKDR